MVKVWGDTTSTSTTAWYENGLVGGILNERVMLLVAAAEFILVDFI
jgi:hypothetical protein